MKKLLLTLLVLVGCSANKIKYTEWETDRFLVLQVTETESVVSTFDNGRVIKITVPEVLTKGEEINLTYRKKTETICTDQNCRLEETYEVK